MRRFAQIYRATKLIDCYKQQILKITPQSLKLNAKALMRQYIAVHIACSGRPYYFTC